MLKTESIQKLPADLVPDRGHTAFWTNTAGLIVVSVRSVIAGMPFLSYPTGSSLRHPAKVPKREVDLASDLIEKMTSDDFEPEKYQSEYRERFLPMVDQKIKGEEVTVQTPSPERRGKVVDIFAGLKQSLEQATPQRQPARERARNTARRRRKA